ncbi:hypothetical protein E2C01_069353 [Portunus trituberculatus]|uniref:Uncharacterized protein n=1 Tax=Portunus trituberculatus TaxID=210409 RepID=A0A5B7HRC4_PORTR|nr:hypothetical protein [Portunus trituberculatus]
MHSFQVVHTPLSWQGGRPLCSLCHLLKAKSTNLPLSGVYHVFSLTGFITQYNKAMLLTRRNMKFLHAKAPHPTPSLVMIYTIKCYEFYRCI